MLVMFSRFAKMHIILVSLVDLTSRFSLVNSQVNHFQFLANTGRFKCYILSVCGTHIVCLFMEGSTPWSLVPGLWSFPGWYTSQACSQERRCPCNKRARSHLQLMQPSSSRMGYLSVIVRDFLCDLFIKSQSVANVGEPTPKQRGRQTTISPFWGKIA